MANPWCSGAATQSTIRQGGGFVAAAPQPHLRRPRARRTALRQGRGRPLRAADRRHRYRQFRRVAALRAHDRGALRRGGHVRRAAGGGGRLPRRRHPARDHSGLTRPQGEEPVAPPWLMTVQAEASILISVAGCPPLAGALASAPRRARSRHGRPGTPPRPAVPRDRSDTSARPSTPTARTARSAGPR
jgi:hypothetical protein